MLLPLLTVTAVLIGSWTFAAIIDTWVRNTRLSAQLSIFPNKKVSLYSLILFLFFPMANTPLSSEPSLPQRIAREAPRYGRLNER